MDLSSFERSKLDLDERERHREWYVFHRDLLRLRRSDPVLRQGGRRAPDGAVIAPEAFLLRFQGGEDGDRLLLVNLGCDPDLQPVPEPLLAPPAGCHWVLQWSSEWPRYGGSGTPPVRPHGRFRVQGASTVLLRSEGR